MVNRTDKDVEKAMLNALTGLKEMQRDMEQKQDKRFWADIKIPFTLHEGLTKYTKYELDDIRKFLDIQRASSLRKAELITRIEETLPSLLEKICLEFDEERFRMLVSMVRNDGYVKAINIENKQISYWRSSGMVYTGTYMGNKILALPTELIEPILTLEKNVTIRAIIKRNTEWLKLTHGLLYYYGTLGTSTLIDFIEKYTNEKVELRAYFNVLHSANTYRKEHSVDSDGYSNLRVFDPSKVLAEHRKRENISYYPFTKGQLLKAGESGFVDRNRSYQQLVHYLTKNFVIKKNEADSLVEECVYATRIGESPNDVMKFLASNLEFESMEIVQELMDLVVNLMNNTREWFLKGHTPTELLEVEKKFLNPIPKTSNALTKQKVEKVGRNDPCPCGSGKKYKKCCGK
ncbi:SEC-C metal-binding domain-containing protein [Ornithinibacillus halotolerans]|uniref:Preprotein translocase subunit SecA n=1 Tax=Ornithinibacillus halotolerans TaxID=1274357 RepID=A0A916S2P5_9BACI|nr:SEC-C metal-binding domain-containing protein [Ornithinibacillus halotolerans]GGA80067.1 preprotein translocase subunit SecA [Ornithinibacillus halotolerans]